MIFAAFPGERDPHDAILDEQRKRIEVNRGLVERNCLRDETSYRWLRLQTITPSSNMPR